MNDFERASKRIAELLDASEALNEKIGFLLVKNKDQSEEIERLGIRIVNLEAQLDSARETIQAQDEVIAKPRLSEDVDRLITESKMRYSFLKRSP